MACLSTVLFLTMNPRCTEQDRFAEINCRMVPVTELKMAINTTFTSILNEIQLSNLNFSIQTTPFAAYITLKKSVQKDLNGDYATPSPTILHLLQETQRQILYLKN